MRSGCASDAKPVRNLRPLLNSQDKNNSNNSNRDPHAKRACDGVVAAAAAAAAARSDVPEDVLATLRALGIGDELLRHPNATTERLTWIARTAASRGSPGGWAASAIRDGYSVPVIHGNGATNGAASAIDAGAYAVEETRRMLDAKRPERGAMTFREARAAGLVGMPGEVLAGGLAHA